MAGVENRPFAGSWTLNNRTVVKYTPDALVFINGDTSMPGCPRCRGRIDIQNFVTSMSVEAGTTPGSHSANINLTLPRVQGQQVFIDGYNILRPGLEVHIFMRGYFPLRGMFAHLPNPNEVAANPNSTAAQQASAISSLNYPNAAGTNRLDMTKYATYPYYPVFHGVVTQVSYDYGDGFYTGSLHCASLLHFWQYQNINTSAAWLAKNKPTNDPGRTTLFGHNFNSMHPFSIIYTLYKDIAGAAMGVDFALSEESNLDAVSNTTGLQGQQVFDHMTLYWEQRFRTRIQDLRMYGVNGTLYNAVQQAWLASASNRDIDRLLTSPTFNDPESTRTERDPFSSRQSVAKALGLQNAGTDFVFSPLIQQNNELFNLSVLDMFAFTPSQGEIGPVNKWQSTYQTKMAIAQQVCEVTGYEFYQDVDGDLVFKPPFYNLDTATSRFYRLEDQDIISISFVEKEPTATYMIVRGVWVAGFTDIPPVQGATNKRGMYVDYKLVAQFGWRPGPSLDLPYITDPKVCFWIAVARLDLMNVDTFSASAAIPIRPEMRPGYPVYIPFADCYYYISQLSHQFAFGGQCTTNLTLTCRRAKFHAPGLLQPASEGNSAIDLIRLDRPDLPPRPLETYDTSLVGGREPVYIPRIVGFPNVVMALDPQKWDPAFSLVGVGIDYFDSVDIPADLLFALLQRDVNNLNAFEAVGYDKEDATGRQVIPDPSQITTFKLRWGSAPTDSVTFTLDDLKEAFIERQQFYGSDGSLTENRSKQRQEQLGTNGVLQLTQAENVFTQEQKIKGQSGTPSGARSAAQGRLDDLRAEEFNLTQSASSGAGTQLLDRIFTALQPTGNRPIARKVDGIPGSDVTLSWFQSLTHLKGQYMADTLPGQYRYFSCAHPNEHMQGMPIIEWEDEDLPTASGGAAAQRSRGKRGRIGSRQRQAKNLFQGLESVINLPGFTDMAMGYVKKESNFSTNACNPGFVNKYRAYFAGEAYKKPPQAQQTDQDKGSSHTKAQAQQFLKQQKRNWGDTTYGLDADAWSECATGGWFQTTTRTAMGKVSAKDSKYRNARPSDLVRDPCSNTGLYLQTMYNYLRGKLWQSLAPEDQTYMNLRYLTGAGPGVFQEMINNGSASRKWTTAEVKEYLIQDDFEVQRQISTLDATIASLSAVGSEIPESLTEQRRQLVKQRGRKGPSSCRLRFKDPETSEVTFDVRFVEGGSKFDPQRFRNTTGFRRTGKFIQGVCQSTGKTLDESVKFAQSQVPTDQWIANLERAGADRNNADALIDLSCQIDGSDPLGTGVTDNPTPVATDSTTRFGGAVTPVTGPKIFTTDLSLETPRTVVQFSTTVTTPPGQRPPEVELVLGKCSKGLQIAQGPQRTPRVVTTDQIQTISFIRHKARKNTALIGTSVTSGRNTFNGTNVKTSFAQQLASAANQLIGDGDPSELTVSELFQDAYDEIGVQIETIEYPVYDDGNETGTAQVTLVDFDQAVVQPSATNDPNTGNLIVNVPASVLINLGLLGAGGSPSPDITVPVAGLTMDQVIQLQRYKPAGAQKADSQGKYSRAIDNLAADYAQSITKQVEQAWIVANEDASTPTTDKLLRLAKIRNAFEQMLGKSAENDGQVLQGILASSFQDKTSKDGKKDSPLHTPVFPVSDEKGYQHYGAYRYGRGLSIEPGGTFEFIHSGQDPFKNVTAATAEQFLEILTLQKQGRISANSNELAGLKDAAVRIARDLFEQKQTPLEDGNTQVAPRTASQKDLQIIESQLLNLAQVVSALQQTGTGRDQLRELLGANGDDPNLVDQGPLNPFDTQFARNFANFAVNYGKSSVFKTTVANAAWQLADLTAHLLGRAGSSCVCRGSYADITLSAYSRDNFVGFDPESGVTAEEPAVAFETQTIASKLRSWRAQQTQYRGQIRQGNPPDAAAFGRAGGTQAASGGTALPSSTQVPSNQTGAVVTPENPPTTTNPNTFPTSEPEGPTPLPGIEDIPGPIQPLEGETAGPLIEGDEELPSVLDD